MEKTKKMKDWINKRRSLNINSLEKEANLAQGTLSKYLKGKRPLSESNREALLEVLKKYGFKGDIGTNN